MSVHFLEIAAEQFIVHHLGPLKLTGRSRLKQKDYIVNALLVAILSQDLFAFSLLTDQVKVLLTEPLVRRLAKIHRAWVKETRVLLGHG
jgi:hypothetical protein